MYHRPRNEHIQDVEPGEVFFVWIPSRHDDHAAFRYALHRDLLMEDVTDSALWDLPRTGAFTVDRMRDNVPLAMIRTELVEGIIVGVHHVFGAVFKQEIGCRLQYCGVIDTDAKPLPSLHSRILEELKHPHRSIGAWPAAFAKDKPAMTEIMHLHRLDFRVQPAST